MSPETPPKFPFQNCLVTGGAGFIGSHVVERLLALGCAVRVIDDLSTGRKENLAHLKGYELIQGRVQDRTTMRECLADIQVVFHLAARTSVPRSFDDPQKTHLVNSSASLLIAKLSAEMGVKVLVYSSSSSIYGDKQNPMKSERMRPEPKSPYAISKLAGERYCLLYGGVSPLKAVSLRYFNVFGPRQDPSSPYSAVIPRFIEAQLKAEPPVIFGDGTQTRDFTFVDNVVSANLLAASAPPTKPQAFNIGTGKKTSINQLLGIIQSHIKSPPPMKPEYQPPRKGDVLHSQANIRKAERLLGYNPRVSLKEGLVRTIQWFQTHR